MNFHLHNLMHETADRRRRQEARREYMRGVGLMVVLASVVLAAMLYGHVADRIAEARQAPTEFQTRY